MKKLQAVLAIIFFALSVYSQDLIVTNRGDSINCRITKTRKDYFYFTFMQDSKIRNTLIPVSEVKIHQTKFYAENWVPDDRIIWKEDYRRVRVALNGGYSKRSIKYADVSGEYKSHLEALKEGIHFSGDITYYVTEPLGFGVKYSMYKTLNTSGGTPIKGEEGNIKYGNISDDIIISFIGPSISTKYFYKDKDNALLMNLSIGYMRYRNNKIELEKYIITGGTIAMCMDVGYDIKIANNLFLGLQASFYSGLLSGWKIDDGTGTKNVKFEDGKYESLNRVDISVGLRFSK